MKKNDTGRFLYHAQGMGLGGFLTAPVDEFIETQAAVSLPITGGYGRADVKDFRFRDFVSLREAHSYVTGKKKTPVAPPPNEAQGAKDEPVATYETLVTCVVEGLNILDVVTADRIVARLVSKGFGIVGKPPEISTIGSYFLNLRIKGEPVNLELLDAPDAREEDAREEDAREENDAKETKASSFTFMPMLPELPPGLQKYKLGPNSLYIPHFGSIYLGELIVSAESQRLTMLRVELGCSADGSITANSVEGDGHQT